MSAVWSVRKGVEQSTRQALMSTATAKLTSAKVRTCPTLKPSTKADPIKMGCAFKARQRTVHSNETLKETWCQRQARKNARSNFYC